MAGFFKVDNDVIDKMKFTNAVEYYVYTIILRYSNGGRMAFPSIEHMRKIIGCSNRKISASLKALEERKLVVIYRTPGKNNKYLPFKEQEKIEEVLKDELEEIVKKEQENSQDNYKWRKQLLSFIHEDIAIATDRTIKEVRTVFPAKKISISDLERIRKRINNSEFLRGEAGEKPTLRHFGSMYQIDKILEGYYDSWEDDEY
ncbi:MAG: helix-turn-helix domain-containing protein [Fusobacteriaceae bacterium]